MSFYFPLLSAEGKVLTFTQQMRRALFPASC